MKAIKKNKLKIDKNGDLLEYNLTLKRWELVSRPWSWSDIAPGHLRTSKQNWKKRNN